MLFNSVNYFIFLPIVYLIFYFTKDKYRWIILLISSFIFYAFLKSPCLIGVIVAVGIITYFFGIKIENEKEEVKQKKLLIIGVLINLAVLVIMKYIPFITDNLNLLFDAIFGKNLIPAPPLIISVGVSFYIFQVVSYLNDIYLGKFEAEKHFGYFMLYISFFPKLLQGPIERGNKLLPQFKNKYEFNYDNMRSGLLRFTWGLFKKVVIADRLAVLVSTVFDNPNSYSGLPVIIAVYAFAFQIYIDFSAYMDMAIGSARLFNISLSENFNKPYLSTSVADFWRRWHITLSAWLQDYIFKPLQMKWRRSGKKGIVLALIITFGISGIWHGAAWTFVLWGLLHGTYLSIGYLYKPYQKKIYKRLKITNTKILKIWKIFITFNLITFAWIFFRSTNLNNALTIIENLFKNLDSQLSSISLLKGSLKLGLGKTDLLIAFAAFMLFLFGDLSNIKNNFYRKKTWFRWTVYYLIFMIIIFFYFRTTTEFVYFNF